jgi:preprotein translocase subunit SecF
MAKLFDLNNFYSGNYKRYMLLPTTLFFLFLFAIIVFPGIKQGIDLKGGTNIVIRAEKPLDAKLLLPKLKSEFNLTDLQVGSISSPTGYGLYIQFSENQDLAKANSLLTQAKNSLDSNPTNAVLLAEQSIAEFSKFAPFQLNPNQSPQETIAAAEEALIKAEEQFEIKMQKLISETYGLDKDIKMQKTVIGPTLSQTFYSTGLLVMLLGIILLSLVVFIYFRELLTSMTVIGASMFNIIGALAFMAVLSIPVSLTTIPALLMLIGYSVDTEIVMSSRVLKRKEESPKQRMNESLLTILTMSSTALTATGIMALLAYFSQIGVIFEISVVLFFGLVADVISSTMFNAPLILSHAEKEEQKA